MKPRPAHHIYAHRGLPHTFLRDPPGIMSILAGEQALEFLSGMWTVVEEELEEDQRMGSEGLALDVYEVGEDVHAAIVTMPAPEREFEARYVALVARLEEPGSFARVFSMVGTEPPAAHSEVALLEWDNEGKYSFIEERCGPTVDDFVDALERVLAKGGG